MRSDGYCRRESSLSFPSPHQVVVQAVCEQSNKYLGLPGVAEKYDLSICPEEFLKTLISFAQKTRSQVNFGLYFAPNCLPFKP